MDPYFLETPTSLDGGMVPGALGPLTDGMQASDFSDCILAEGCSTVNQGLMDIGIQRHKTSPRGPDTIVECSLVPV